MTSALRMTASGTAGLHRCDHRVKLSGALAFIVVVVACPLHPLWRFAAFGAVLFALMLLSRVPVKWMALRLLLLTPFLLTFLISVPFVPASPGDPAVVIPGLHMHIARSMWQLCTSIIVRSVLTVGISAMLLATTPVTDVLEALRALRVPAILVTLLAFMVRYVEVLTDEATRLVRARDSRCPGRLPPRRLVNSTGQLIGSLFVRSLNRSTRVARAMTARGFTGEWPALPYPALKARSIIGTVLFVAAVVCVGAMRR